MYSACPKGTDELIGCVSDAFDSLHRNVIDDVFLSVQASMRDSLKCDGDNIIPLSHMDKECLCCGGQLPIVLNVDHHLLSKAWKFLETTEAEPEPKPEPDSHSDCDSSVASKSDADPMSETKNSPFIASFISCFSLFIT